MAEPKRVRISVTPEIDRALAERAKRVRSTKTHIAYEYLVKGMMGERTEQLIDEQSGEIRRLADLADALMAELRSLRKEAEQLSADNRRLAEIAYANLASNAWVGKQTLCAEYGYEPAKRFAAMLAAMTPAQVCGMLERMGEHMAATGGDLRRAQAVICDLPGVDVRLMGFRDDDEWRAGYDANGDPIPGYISPLRPPKNYDDIFHEDEDDLDD